MPRYIAFLRAINVGGHTVKMDRLRALFAELGFDNVQTFIASGNVIFDSPETDTRRLEEQIEAHLKQTLGYEAATLLRTTEELAEVARSRPFEPEDMDEPGNYLYVLFLQTELPEAAKEKVLSQRTPVDEFHVQGREVYWLCRKKISETLVNEASLGRAIGLPATMRNMTTVRRLAAKYPPAAQEQP